MHLTRSGIGLLLLISAPSFSGAQYPIGPSPRLTPGTLCKEPSEYRYPERIPYCNRDVDGALKDQVVARYDQVFGYQIARMGRRNFKIDHYIPLCMGGGNDEANLWPQHPSIYAITDPLEDELCKKMREGKLKQVDAIRLIQQAKNNLAQTPEIRNRVGEL